MSIAYIKETSTDAMLGLWHITESVEELLKPLHLSANDYTIYHNKKTDSRKREWLACKNLVKEMLAKEVEIEYDQYGKPFLIKNELQISISHSGKYACVYLHKFLPIGVDIQKLKTSIATGRSYFLSDKEMEWVNADNNDMLYIIWSAKESVFKYFGVNALNAKKDVIISPFTSNQNGIIEVTILNQDQKENILVTYEIFDGYVLTRTV